MLWINTRHWSLVALTYLIVSLIALYIYQTIIVQIAVPSGRLGYPSFHYSSRHPKHCFCRFRRFRHFPRRLYRLLYYIRTYSSYYSSQAVSAIVESLGMSLKVEKSLAPDYRGDCPGFMAFC
jgi:hypothetical protein